jgi:hypothetical protein
MKKTAIVALLSLCFAAPILAADATSGAQAGATSGSLSGGNTLSNGIIFTNPANTTSTIDSNVSGTQTVRSAPTVYAPPIGVTAPCMVALSGGVSVVGVGVSMGGSVEDPGCTLRETARLLHGIGEPGAAARIMCNNPMAAKAMGEKVCGEAAAAPTTAAPAKSLAMVKQDPQKDSIVCARTGARC